MTIQSLAELAIVALSSVRLIPHALILLPRASAQSIVQADVARWHDVLRDDVGLRRSRGFWMRWLWLMTFYPEFRNLYYHRAGMAAKLVRPLCPALASLHIATPEIGPGLFIQHGFATVIAAHRIGRDCWINQQVTIGFDEHDRPVIGDRVRVHAGAKVIGAVRVGDDCIIGANAAVVKSLAAGSTVVPARSRIVRRNGERVDERL